jgi:hypothetical protein
MNAKDDSKVTDYLAALTTDGQTASIEFDINLPNDERATFIRTSPDGKRYCHVTADSEAGEEFANELAVYPPESSSSSSSSSS